MNFTIKNLQIWIKNQPQQVKIAGNIGWLFFDKVLRMGAGLIVGAWIARYLGPQQFGILNFATAFAGVFGTIATIGLPSIIVRDLIQQPCHKELTLGSAALLQFIGSLFAYTLLLIAITYLEGNESITKYIVIITGLTIIFKASEISTYWFESQVQSKYTVLSQNCIFLFFLLVKAVLILLNLSLTAFAWATTCEAMMASLLLLIMLNRNGLRLIKLRASLKRIRILLRDSWSLLFSGIAIMLYMKIDQIMLGKMIDNETVGIFSAASRISEVWYFIPMSISASVLPAILEARKQNETKYYKYLQNLFDLMVLIAMALALPMTLLSESIVTSLYGNDYLQSGKILAVHIWASVFVFLGVAGSNWFLAENKQILSLKRTLIGATINIILNYFSIPKYGALGAAWATVISQAAASMLADYTQQETRILFYMKLSSLNIFKTIFTITNKIIKIYG